jgi:hypothetical protein
VAKRAVSITLEESNLVWLKGRVGAQGARSISELVDRLVREARTQGSSHAVTSVVGTIDISDSDPKLLGADAAIRALYQASLDRPLLVREPAKPSSRRRTRRG